MRRGRRAKDAPLVELSHCDVVLSGRAALADVSFVLRRGECWALLGANGAGKTLFLKLLRGDVWPTPRGPESRSYLYDGESQSQPPPPGERMPYVGPERQDRYERYGWNFTVRETVTTGLYDEDVPLTSPTRIEQARVSRLLVRFGLASVERRRLLSLSYGQRRLVMVARAFARPAAVVLLDEVFNGLDARTRARLLDAIERRSGAATWILSAHREHDVPRSVTHVLRLEEGRVIEGRRLRRGEVLRPTVGEGRLAGSSAPVRKRAVGRAKAAEPLVRIANATIYRDYRLVVRELDWIVHDAEHWAVTGRNGAGKSTLLRLIYGDLHPALGGTIERRAHPRGTPIEFWRRRVGLVSPELQSEHAHAGTLAEVVVSGLRASIGLDAAPTPAERRRASRWLTYFGIGELADRRTREVSYGQVRLALLARAMVNEPELLLLDEPCTGLDAMMRLKVLALLERLARDGSQLILAVHQREDLIPAVSKLLEIRPDGRTRIIEREVAARDRPAARV